MLDFRVSFVVRAMKTSDQIIIEELKRIVLMQAQENTLLKARIDVLECELTRYTTRKDSNNSSLPSSKDENRPPRTSSLREKSNRKAGGQRGHFAILKSIIDTAIKNNQNVLQALNVIADYRRI